MKKSINNSYLLVILSVLSTLAPLSIATYIPSMKEMAMDFNVSISKIEFSLSLFIFGLAIGQVFGGAFSDRKGRKFSSLTGLLGFAVFSILIIFSNSIYELWLGRFFQAFFSGLILVNATAIIRDIFEKKEASKFFSLLGSLRSIVPMLSPALGSVIIVFFSWRAIFVFLALYALLFAFLIFKDLEESYTYVKINVWHSYLSVLKHKKAMQMMFVLALGFSCVFLIVTKSSYIYMQYFDVSSFAFSLYYALNFSLVVLFAALNIKLIKFLSQINILKSTVIFQIVLACIFFTFHTFLNIYSAAIIIALFVGSNGFIYGNATALILNNFPKNAGVASALIGVVQFGLASFVSTLVVSFHLEGLFVIALFMLIIPTLSIIILRKY